MVKKIEKKIVSYKVANNDSVEEKTAKATDNNMTVLSYYLSYT